MKIIYTGAIFAILALNLAQADIRKDFNELRPACMKESKATAEDLNKFFSNGLKYEDATDAVKCHLKCMMEKKGHFVNGAIDQTRVMKLFDKVPALKEHLPAIEKAVTECKQKKGVDICDTAMKILVCFNENEAGKIALAAY